jgi:hypothetical protein
MTFVPPGADYSSVSQVWQRFTSPALTVITLSSSGALSSSCRETTYCDAAGQQGSWLMLPKLLLPGMKHILLIYMLKIPEQQQIVSLPFRTSWSGYRYMPLSSDHTCTVYCDFSAPKVF